MTYHSDPVPFWCSLDPAFRDALAGALWADDMGQVLGLDAAMRLLAPARRSVVLAQGRSQLVELSGSATQPGRRGRLLSPRVFSVWNASHRVIGRSVAFLVVGLGGGFSVYALMAP